MTIAFYPTANNGGKANKPFKSVRPVEKRARMDADPNGDSGDSDGNADSNGVKSRSATDLNSPPPGNSKWSDSYAAEINGE